MPKRKRGQDTPGHGDFKAARRLAEIERQLAQGTKRLNHALKLVKAFERQKLSKRMKRTDESEKIKRMEIELKVLLALDLSSVAQAHLCRSVRKSDIWRSLPEDFQHYVTEKDAASSQSTIGEEAHVGERNNVLARLYNAKHVKDEMKSTLAVMQSLIEPQGHRENLEKVSESEAKDVKNSLKGNVNDSEPPYDAAVELVGRHPLQNGERDAVSRLFDVDETPESASESVSDPDVTVENPGQQGQITKDNHRRIHDKAASFEDSDSASGSFEETDILPKVSASKVKPSIGESAFLPSLMMGGYWSGSESAEDDIPEVTERKNRRGQRARRQIWEQKYGTKANHIKKGAPDRDWDPKRGATGQKGKFQGANNTALGIRKPGRQEIGFTGKSGSTQAHASETADKPIHPSWQAAKNAKSQKQTAAFQGKKVVFD